MSSYRTAFWYPFSFQSICEYALVHQSYSSYAFLDYLVELLKFLSGWHKLGEKGLKLSGREFLRTLADLAFRAISVRAEARELG
jgi:hypothetical protein